MTEQTRGFCRDRVDVFVGTRPKFLQSRVGVAPSFRCRDTESGIVRVRGYQRVQ